MKKINVYLDMDGTIADLYGIKDWLPRLRNEDKTIFIECAPLITEEELLKCFPADKYEIRILSMTPKDASKEYCKDVVKQKDSWLNAYFPTLTKRIYRKYGHNKNLKGSANAILIDDSEPIRNSWKGTALNPAEMWG